MGLLDQKHLDLTTRTGETKRNPEKNQRKPQKNSEKLRRKNLRRKPERKVRCTKALIY